MSYVFLQSNLEKYKFLKVHKFCQILCFVLKICHNFKSYENMLTLSSFFKNIISYNFLKKTYILHHIYFFKPLFFLNTKSKKYENLSVF
jgi:hypothetical protein